MNELTETERPIDERYLSEIENRLGLRIPPDIRAHYLRYNGGSPTRYLFKRGDRTFVFQEFLPFRFGDYRVEDAFYDLKTSQGLLPANLVPFAIDPGGDFFCFCEQTGEIYFFVVEQGKTPDQAKCYLANSLAELIDGMVENTE